MFAIGLNHRAHANETGFAVPDGVPPVFTKFPSCLTGPYRSIVLPRNGNTDWEVELVAAIGYELRKEFFGDVRPASTLVEVSALVFPELCVEIEAVAAVVDPGAGE